MYDVALKELQAGKKESHWMWFFFPQIHGLGTSELAVRFSIEDCDEAIEYLGHPVLGSRLIDFTNTVLSHPNLSALEIFGEVDALKFKSCMTLFNEVAIDELCFSAALSRFYSGRKDEVTLGLL